MRAVRTPGDDQVVEAPDRMVDVGRVGVLDIEPVIGKNAEDPVVRRQNGCRHQIRRVLPPEHAAIEMIPKRQLSHDRATLPINK